MRLLEKYPTIGMFLSFFVSSCIFAYVSNAIKIILISLSVFLLTSLLFSRFTGFKNKISGFLFQGISLVLAAITLAGCISLYHFDHHANKIDHQSGKTDNVVLRIESCEYSLPYASGYVAVVERSEHLPKRTKILLDTSLSYLESGTILEGDVLYSSLDSISSSSFDGRNYYMSHRIMILAEEEKLEVAGMSRRFSITRIFDKINSKLSAKFIAHCGYDSGGFASAVLLGNKDHLADVIERDFRRIGITHLLVVSGTHFSVIVSMLAYSFKKTRIKRKYRALISIAIIFLMMGITGFTPSVVRAGIMHLLAQLSLIVFRKANMINSFAIAGTLLILINPYATLDCGFQLSFAATYCCIMFQSFKGSFYHWLREKRGITKRRNKFLTPLFAIAETFALTTTITLCTMPLIWLYFGEISLISIPANVIFIPLITLLMYISCAYLLLYPFVIFTPLISAVICAFTDLIQLIASSFSSAKWVMLSVDYPFSPYYLIAIALMLIILPLAKKKGKLILLISSLSLCTVFFVSVFITQRLDFSTVRLSYINEKKNDGIVLKAENEAIIFDMSDASFGFSKDLVYETELMNLCEIEYLFLTHYHNKHVQLLQRISSRHILRGIVLPEPINDKELGIYNTLCDVAGELGVETVSLTAGEEFNFNDIVISLFDRTYLSRSTHPVTAFKIESGSETAIYLSCSFNEADENIIDSVESSDYVIFGAHSPVYKKAFDINFIDDPKAVIFSSDSYDHMVDGLREYINANAYCSPTSGVNRFVIANN